MNMNFKERDNNSGNTSQSSQSSLTELSYESSNVNSDEYSDEYCLPSSNRNRKRKINKRNKRSSNHFQGRPHRKKRRQNNDLPIWMMDIFKQLINRPPTNTTTITVESGAQYCESGAQYFNHIENSNASEAPKLSSPPPPPYSTGCETCKYVFQMASMMMNICEKLIDRSTITVENGGINTKIESGGIYNNIEAGGIYNKINIESGGINNYYHIENYNGLINNCMLKGDDNNEVLNGLNNFDNNKKDVKLNNNNNNASNDDCNDRKYFYQNLNGQKSLQNSESYIYSDYADKKDNEYKIIVSDEKNNNRIDNNDKKSGNKNIRYRNKLKTLTGKHLGAINDENSNNNNNNNFNNYNYNNNNNSNNNNFV